MRIVIYILVIVLIFPGCNSEKNKKEGLSTEVINNPATASNPNSSEELPAIEFKKNTHDFGKIVQGEKVEFAFPFKNIGDGDLIIANVVPSCGCTVPTFPKEPIKPGKKEYIKVVFDSKGRKGRFSKDVTVFANTVPNSVKLFIKGLIVENK